jgi:hypothetical protein
MKTKILNLFATPVIQTEFDAHRKYAGEFGNWEKCDRKPESWHVPLNTSFPEVRQDDPYVPPAIVDDLKEDIMFQIKKIMLSKNMPTDLRYTAFWYNAYYDGQGQEPHNHLTVDGKDPFWSGVYFAKNCFPGSFYFIKTEYSHRTQQSFAHQTTPLRDYYEEFYPTPFSDGNLVLFPPHLHHSVKVGATNRTEQRLTFSFNISHNNEKY